LARLLLLVCPIVGELLTLTVNSLKHRTLILACIALIGCSISDKAIDQSVPSTELLQREREIHRLINQYRLSKKLPPLTANEIIIRQARIHSHAMAKKNVPFGHNGFRKRVKKISRSLPYRTASENVAYNKGYSDCSLQAFQSWLESTEHRKNITGNYRLTGIGVARNPAGGYYFTQIFWQ
jgi:uncharacterized protein YkwD